MKAHILGKHSKIAPLQLNEVTLLSVGDNDVLVKIHSAGINQLGVRIKIGKLESFKHLKNIKQ